MVYSGTAIGALVGAEFIKSGMDVWTYLICSILGKNITVFTVYQVLFIVYFSIHLLAVLEIVAYNTIPLSYIEALLVFAVLSNLLLLGVARSYYQEYHIIEQSSME